MAWFFGGGGNSAGGDKNQNAGQAGGAPAGTSGAADQTLTKAERKAMEAYRFDSSALERAAEAARTLETSSKCFPQILNYFVI